MRRVLTRMMSRARKSGHATAESSDGRFSSGGGVLEVAGLCCGYGEIAAVRGLDLRVDAGEIVALIGANGAGKSTALACIAGELRPKSGSIRWNGEALGGSVHERARRGLAFVPDERAIFASLTAAENLRLGRGGVDAAVALFPELELLLNRKAGLLSGGEQQMLALARAMAASPAVLLIDEISIGLAPLVVERLFAALRHAARDGLGVLLVEQQVKRAMDLADRWVVMRSGVAVASGNVASLDEVEDAYFGTFAGAGRGATSTIEEGV